MTKSTPRTTAPPDWYESHFKPRSAAALAESDDQTLLAEIAAEQVLQHFSWRADDGT